MKIISVVGARPNFMKIAPFIRAIEKHNQNAQPTIEHVLVHTGQHYDDSMSKRFFQALDIPEADINLGIGSGTHAEQVGQTMIAFEKVLKKEKPDWVVVVGDVNATLACSVTAKKELVKLAHIEAGLRSRDMSMPEEINRMVTDRLSDLLLTPDRLSGENLRQEGVPEERIKFVGNIMIDTLEAQRHKAERLSIKAIVQDNALPGQPLDLSPSASDNPTLPYGLITMHRPSNVDLKEVLEPLVDFFVHEAAKDMLLFWPVHPRAVMRLQEFGLWEKVLECRNLVLTQPIGYHELLRLNRDARLMLTDSGGLQEECCILGTPCLTLRWNTERPVTLQEHGGVSVLVGNDVGQIRKAYHAALEAERHPVRPELWDGQTAMRCVQSILS